jgi:DUF1680 family protein
VDVFERVLYNGLLSGVSLSGDRFFYQNPLESAGGYERSPWFEVACCPPNLTRFLPSLPGYVYATKDGTVFVNLYIAGEGKIDLDGRLVTIVQETRYPWDGAVKFTVSPAGTGEFELALRIPGWAREEAMPTGLYRFLDGSPEGPALKVDGEAAVLEIRDGYARIRRSWKKGDTAELILPMIVRRVVADDRVAADRGRVALQRGPVVFAAEAVDNDGRVFDLFLPDETGLKAEFRPDLLDGVEVVTGEGRAISKNAVGKTVESSRPFRAIPYYSWANRGPGQMLVWLPRAAEAVRPAKSVNMKVD